MIKIIICKSCKSKASHYSLGLCEKCYFIQRYKKNRDNLLAGAKEYRRLNKEKIKEHRKIYNKENRQQKREYRLRNRDELRIKREEYRQNGKRTHVRIVKSGYKGSKQYWVYNTGKQVHAVIAEKALGRRLKPSECTHHIDGNGLNNRHSNLLICTKSYHAWLHCQMRSQKEINL